MDKQKPAHNILVLKGEQKVMALTKNPNVLKWLEEMVALTTPDQVVWIDRKSVV